VGKSEQAEYYELVGSIDNDHLPDNNFQFHLVVSLEPDPSVELKFVYMMNQPGYERWDILDGVFVMPFWMKQFDERERVDCTVHSLLPMLCPALILMKRNWLMVPLNPSSTNLTNCLMALKLTSG